MDSLDTSWAASTAKSFETSRRTGGRRIVKVDHAQRYLAMVCPLWAGGSLPARRPREPAGSACLWPIPDCSSPTVARLGKCGLRTPFVATWSQRRSIRIEGFQGSVGCATLGQIVPPDRAAAVRRDLRGFVARSQGGCFFEALCSVGHANWMGCTISAV